LLSGGQGALLALRRERNTFVGVSFLLLFSLRLLLAKKKVIAPSVRGVSDVFVLDESEVWYMPSEVFTHGKSEVSPLRRSEIFVFAENL